MATKNLIPRGSGEGGIGIENVTWGEAYFDTGNFNKGLYISGNPIDAVVSQTITQGGLGGKWDDGTNAGDIKYDGGSVGIGTAQPVTRLHIKGPNNTTFDNIGNIYSEGTDAYNSTNAGCGIQFGGQYNAAGDDAVFGQISAIKENTDDGDYKGALTFGSRDGSTLNMEAMRINSTGNVGIGTTSPGAKLDINGTAMINPTFAAGTNGGWWFGKNSTVQGYVGGGNFAVNGLADVDFGISSATGGLAFGTDTGSEKMRIAAAGNVGIGTTNPGAALHVRAADDSTNALALWVVNKAHDNSIISAYENGNVSIGDFNYKDNTGRVGIGTTSPSTKLDVAGTVTMGDNTDRSPSNPLLVLQGNGYSGQLTVDSAAFYIGQNNGGKELRLWSGAFANGVKLTNGSTSWGTFSDEKLKDNITIIDSVLGKISDIRCANYTLKSDKSPTKRIGFIAQDFVGKFDEVVEKPSRIHGESEEKYLGLKYAEVAPILMKAIQEQQQIIEDLKSRIETLENK